MSQGPPQDIINSLDQLLQAWKDSILIQQESPTTEHNRPGLEITYAFSKSKAELLL